MKGPTNVEVLNNHADVLELHENEIKALRKELDELKAHVELMLSELAYLRAIQPTPLQPVPFQPPIWPQVTWCTTNTGGSA
jgi:hypothetical protein